MTFYMNAKEREKAERIASFTPTVAESNGVSSQWFRHIKDDQAKKEFAAVIRNNVTMLDALKSILVKEYEENLVLNKSDYGKPNWALEQADRAGYLRAIQNFINLLTITT